MIDVAATLSKSIKEGKWVSIEYENLSNGKTSYWCCIHDVDIANKRLFVTAFNHTKRSETSDGIIEAVINFNQIKRVNIIEGTTYDVDDMFIEKLDKNTLELEWLKYDTYSENILEYLKYCIIYDQPPYQKESTLVDGIDLHTLAEINTGGKISLSYHQISQLADGLERLATQYKNNQYSIVDLVVNVLSIKTNQGLFVVAYKRLLFNPIEKSLIINSETEFNYAFLIHEKDANAHNLKNYLDMETDLFVEEFLSNPETGKNLLTYSLRPSEKLDDTPYVMDLVRNYSLNVDKEFGYINQAKQSEKLSTPLESFFGNMRKNKLGRKNDFEIILLNENMNIDQLRVIHNALKHPITFVQGPPGTGKTQSILNLVISTYFNDQTVLITSNNNKPIDDIFDKLQNLRYKNKVTPFPILRLGNVERVLEAIEWIRKTLENYKSEFELIDTDKLEKHHSFSKINFKMLNDVLTTYETRIELEERIEALKSLVEEFVDSTKSVVIQDEYYKALKELNALPMVTDEDAHAHTIKADFGFQMWVYFSSLARLKKLLEPRFDEFRGILGIPEDDKRIRAFNKYLSDDDNFRLLLTVFPIIMSTNMSAPRLGLPKPNFDLVVMDEAGQCSLGYSIFPIIRGKRLLLVGDQNQLKPVVTLNPSMNQKLIKKYDISDNYDFIANSILRTMQSVDTISEFVLLRYHYRCHKDIIEFSNKKYYKSKLKIVPKSIDKEKALFMIDVQENPSSKSNMRNVAKAEAYAIIRDIKEKKLDSVGIVTPFRNQSELIKDILQEENMKGIDVGTIHTFQGDEKDIIYMSTAITPQSLGRTFDWAKCNQELINVATTRAKKEFILVGDYKEIEKRSKVTNDLKELVDYVKNNGENIVLSEVKGDYIINGANYKQYNTIAEKELYSTVKHFLTTAERYSVKTQVKVSELLNKYTTPELFDYGIKSVFDFVLYKKQLKDDIPVLVVELDGTEHMDNPKVIKRDQKKNQICEQNGIKILRIPNDYSRRYEFVRENIISLLKA